MRILNGNFQKTKKPEVPRKDIYKSVPSLASREGSQKKGGKHREKVAQAGTVSQHYFALVHTPVSVKEAMQTKEGREALDKEWKKLEKKNYVDWNSVAEYESVRKNAQKEKRTVHFGRVYPLCHIKNSQLSREKWNYKGRVVFEGNRITDQDGTWAVFSEQGTSASHLSAAKFLDALARMPGNAGQDSDAMGAYTQTELLGEETWVTMPPERWPKHWHGKFHRPVVRLRLNLYGHPCAGLYWEKHCRNALTKCGFEPVRGWECLYKHHDAQLFLSVYVDDFKMAGRASSLAPMWEKLKQHLDLDPPVDLHSNIYLGCSQRNIQLPPERIAERQQLYKSLFADTVHGQKRIESAADLRTKQIESPQDPTLRGYHP